MEIKFGWEPVYTTGDKGHGGPHETTFRAKVHGGYIYRHVHYFKVGNDPGVTQSMVFVPDPHTNPK